MVDAELEPPASVACSVEMRCANCRRIARVAFDLPAASHERMQRDLDERSIEVWSAFRCERCDYDRAYVLAYGPDASRRDDVSRAARPT